MIAFEMIEMLLLNLEAESINNNNNNFPVICLGLELDTLLSWYVLVGVVLTTKLVR